MPKKKLRRFIFTATMEIIAKDEEEAKYLFAEQSTNFAYDADIVDGGETD